MTDLMIPKVTKARTVGNFISPLCVLLVWLFVAAACFAFVQTVLWATAAGICILVCIQIYVLGVLRAVSRPRFYVTTYIGSQLAFSSAASLQYPPTDYKLDSAFDAPYLRDMIVSHLIGLFICLLVNVLVFPDFAETHLKDHLEAVIPKLSLLTSLIISKLSNPAEYIATDLVHSDALVQEIQRDFGAIDSEIAQASAEISYSRFSIKDYARIAGSFKSVAAVLFSLQTSLSNPALRHERLQNGEQQQPLIHISSEMKEGWHKLNWSCQKLFNSITTNLKNHHQSSSTHFHPDTPLPSTIATENTLPKSASTDDAITEVIKSGREALSAFEMHQPDMFMSIFNTRSDANVDGDAIEEGAAFREWEIFLHMSLCIHAAKELVSELTLLHDQTARFVSASRKLRVHINQYLPEHPFESVTQFCMKSKYTNATSVRQFMIKLKNNFISKKSIYGLKCSFALLCMLIIIDIYKHWYFSGAIGIFIVSFTPSLGQTYTVLPLTIGGISVGATIAYASVTIFGKTSFGHIGFGALIGIPFFYLQLFNPRASILGLLALLAFSNYICNSYANITTAGFDTPAVYLYRVVAILSCTLSFAVVLNLLVYPAFARHILRDKMSAIFFDFGTFYRQIASNMYPSESSVSLAVEDSDTKDRRNQIFSQIAALEPLLEHSSAEPRLEGVFPTRKYREVVQRMYRLLDRLECLRLSAGRKRFERDVDVVMNSFTMAEARAEMIQTLRLLLNVYSSVMKTKQKMLPSLPNATRVRHRLVGNFLQVVLRHSKNQNRAYVADALDGIMPVDKKRILEALNSEKWMKLLSYFSAIREVSQEVDEFASPMKEIFGEYPEVLSKEGSFPELIVS
ncbi:hypothetical protein HK100_012765 [Physocladia obscura]|uniref:Uncharacterized protein n=1 Tax=Physocladia obscura TaxID=109957 RepID=A0AAD5XHM8_9FUNG|nr:hypothetical protein HK100_012765 [Physocladia obscura]